MEEPLLPSEDEGYLEFSKVVEEEQECIKQQRANRVPDEEEGASERFSLAFSGGGIRAAAFQAGVLWRLAELNRLKDVEYFTAVSGGGYITSAFASHCANKEPPQPGEVRKWYIDVVAEVVTRMQANAGDFVRDCVAVPDYVKTTPGAGALPRWMDLPILLVSLFSTLMVNPITFVVVIVVPIVIAISSFYGSAMRAAFCVPGDSDTTWWDIYYEFSPFQQLFSATLTLMVLTFVCFLLRTLVKDCKLTPSQDGGRPTASTAYLCGHAAYGCLKRFTIGASVLVLFLFLVPCLQTVTYSPASRRALCSEYIEMAKGANIDCVDAYNSGVSNQGAFVGATWYESYIFKNYSLKIKADQSAKESAIAKDRDIAPGPLKHVFQASTLYLFFAFWFLVLTLSVCIMPVLGKDFLLKTLFLTGPALLLVAILAFVQYVVYGPITKNRNGLLPYSYDSYESCVTWSLWAGFFIIPFYEELRSALHTYYKRCLTENYFKDGQDMEFSKLAEHPYCPFVILTGTSSDFQPPGDHDVISELSFSALHTGSEETRYVKTPDFRSLGKCTALTGAGCLDAISLSMNDALALRFWLEVLNLSWGDYILFQGKGCACIENLVDGFGFANKGLLVRCLSRVPSGIIWMFVWIWLLIAWDNQKNTVRAGDCGHFQDLIRMCGAVMLFLIGLSFFSFASWISWLSMSPLLRQIQQATKYFYVGRTPPQMLYVTDGGVKDCTSLVQLMRRKSKRILLVLAAADPHDDLAVLKTAMDVAKEQKIGCFYDPVDPRRDLTRVFKEYKEDRSIPYLHVGISYCWPGPGEEETHGHLYIVKNRLPPEFEGRDVPTLLTPEEVRGEAPPAGPDLAFVGLKTDQLGPCGCCDCCHTSGLNCGPKFPHGNFAGYMYLSPQWSNNLTRLGYAVSQEAVDRVSSPSQLSASWEGSVQ